MYELTCEDCGKSTHYHRENYKRVPCQQLDNGLCCHCAPVSKSLLLIAAIESRLKAST